MFNLLGKSIEHMCSSFEKCFDKIEASYNNSYIECDDNVNIQIGNKKINGKSIQINNDTIIIDGKKISNTSNVPEIVINGNVKNVDGTKITVIGNCTGNIDGTTITIKGDVTGDIDGTTITVEGNCTGNIDGTNVNIKRGSK